MEVINSNNNHKQNSKKDFAKKIGTWTLFSIALIILIIFATISAKKSFKVLEDYHADKSELVQMAQFSYFGTDYEFRIGGSEYLVELFPFGVTDNDLYQPDGMRLIKTTWYNKKGEASNVEYSIVPPPEYAY